MDPQVRIIVVCTTIYCVNFTRLHILLICLLCRLERAGLLPLARMVEATGEDVVDADDGEDEQAERSRRFPYDQSLLSALVDRWRPETHTFHLPFAEMTVTLQDVAMLTGLPLQGRPIVTP